MQKWSNGMCGTQLSVHTYGYVWLQKTKVYTVPHKVDITNTVFNEALCMGSHVTVRTASSTLNY